MSDAEDQAKPTKTPPYVSFRTFMTCVQDLHDHGIPARIDRSVLTRFSGVVGTQLMTALRFLGLIDKDGVPQESLRRLVSVYGSADFKSLLADILRAAYAPLFAIDLAAATPSLFYETFRKAFATSDAVAQKCAVFFLYAAKEAGIPISERVLSGRKPRQPAKRRNGTSAGKKTDSSTSSERGSESGLQKPLPTQHVTDPIIAQMVDKFPTLDPAWPDDVKAKWFDSFATMFGLLQPSAKKE